MEINRKIQLLIDKGVSIPAPLTIEISDDVNIDRISGKGVVIHSGCRIRGASTLISQNSIIGLEGPVTIENCWIGPSVQLKGGYFKQAVFLKKSGAGLGAHVREGTILEEEAGIAHTVGLKQTILFPFVTLGSLINFCDCFMAGGTSRQNHSEVGSSYIHFNYTPNQDKATASMMGDVPKGVMLNNNPVFLGGQGGLVGPCRLNYGTVVAAGTLQRKDELKADRLLFGGAMKRGSVSAAFGTYQNVKKIIKHNIHYIANLIALLNWYEHVRSLFIGEDFSAELLDGLKITVGIAIKERIKRLKGLKEKFVLSIELSKNDAVSPSRSVQQQQEFIDNWDLLEKRLEALKDPGLNLFREAREPFLDRLKTAMGDDKDYIESIRQLDDQTRFSGTFWLEKIVDHVNNEIIQILPLYQ